MCYTVLRNYCNSVTSENVWFGEIRLAIMMGKKLFAAAALAFNLILTATVPAFANTLVVIEDAEVPEAAAQDFTGITNVTGTKIQLTDYSFRIPDLYDGYLVVDCKDGMTEIHFAPAYMEGEDNSLLFTICEVEDMDVEILEAYSLLAIKGSTSYVMMDAEGDEEMPLPGEMISKLKASVKKSFTVVIE